MKQTKTDKHLVFYIPVIDGEFFMPFKQIKSLKDLYHNLDKFPRKRITLVFDDLLTYLKNEEISNKEKNSTLIYLKYLIYRGHNVLICTSINNSRKYFKDSMSEPYIIYFPQITEKQFLEWFKKTKYSEIFSDDQKSKIFKNIGMNFKSIRNFSFKCQEEISKLI
jgi:hypothetical protein